MDRDGIHELELPLCWPHGRRREALGELHRAESLSDRCEDLLRGDVLRKVDESVAVGAEEFGMWVDRQRRDRDRIGGLRCFQEASRLDARVALAEFCGAADSPPRCLAPGCARVVEELVVSAVTDDAPG